MDMAAVLIIELVEYTSVMRNRNRIPFHTSDLNRESLHISGDVDQQGA